MSRITINSNIASLTAQRRLSDSTRELRSTFEKLSSGLRITRAGDDAAGLAVSELLNVDQRVYGQGIKNLNDGVSALSIAGAGLKELSSIVIRIRELATQSANGVLGPKQRQSLDEEAQELSKEFTRIVKTTQFNGIGLLDGETQEFRFQGGYGSAQTVVSGLGGAMGEGTFTESDAFATFGTETRSSALADFNGDGLTDLVTGSEGDVMVFMGNGDGTFTLSERFTALSGHVVVGDFDGDGINDIAAAGYYQKRLDILLGQGDGTFLHSETIISPNNTSFLSLSIGDVNGDGTDDLVGVGYYDSYIRNGKVTVLIGDGAGGFVPGDCFDTADTNKIYGSAVGDINGDGFDDLVTRGNSATRVFLADAEGNLIQSSTFASSSSVLLADMDNDGTLDLLTGANVYLGTGDGSFNFHETVAIGSAQAQAADMNGDGFVDLIGSTGIWYGAGNGSFEVNQTISYNLVSASSFSLGDLNGNGVLDLVANGRGDVGGGGEAIVRVYVANTKNGTSPIVPFDLTTKAGARESMAMLDRKLSSLSTQQGIIGAFEAQLQVELGNLDSARENYIAARSRITDADTAEEAAKLARLQILQNASISVLGQANLQPQIAIQLINSV